MMKTDPSKKSNDAQIFQYALTEMLIESGLIEAEEFKKILNKWRTNFGHEEIEDPLHFLSLKSTPVHELNFPEAIQGKRFMIIDDVQCIRESIKNILILNRCYVVAETDNGDQAIELFRRSRPDIVLLDIQLQGLNGMHVLQKIRSIDKNVPVIMMTGHPDKDYVKQAYQIGMTDFIVKPIDLKRLFSILEKISNT